VGIRPRAPVRAVPEEDETGLLAKAVSRAAAPAQHIPVGFFQRSDIGLQIGWKAAGKSHQRDQDDIIAEPPEGPAGDKHRALMAEDGGTLMGRDDRLPSGSDRPRCFQWHANVQAVRRFGG
jgi:hypothetical protein